jgi:hypothetical protein
MAKRILAGLLWFGALWFGYEIVWSLFDVPRMIGPIVAAVVAAYVAIDPAARFWSLPAPRRARDLELTPSNSPS